MANNRGKVLAVWIGDPLSYHSRVRNWVDMFRYDRCYPVSEFAPTTEPFKGWCIFHQPFQNGLPVGFTIDRWKSFGVTIAVEFNRGSAAGHWLSYEDQGRLAAFTAEIKAKQKEMA